MTLLALLLYAASAYAASRILDSLDSRAALRDGERRHHPIVLATLAAGWPIVLAVCVPVLVLLWAERGKA